MDLRSLTAAPAAGPLTDRIGNTPLVPIPVAGLRPGVELFGKAEWFNPGGSVKDRAAWAMIQAGERSGALGPGVRLIDATSGNTGIAYAWIGAARGWPVTLCLPGNAGVERKRWLAALGAELVLTDPMDGTDGAIREARRRVAADPARWFYPDQYSNPENWRAHERATAREIWDQTQGRVTHLVAGIGTSGTLVGTSRGLRALAPAIVVIAVQPDSPLHVMEGLKHLPSCMVPAIYDAGVHQRTVEVTSEEAIDAVMHHTRHGMAIGWSAGAAIAAATRVARELESGVVVAILPDGADRYLGDPLWEDAR